MLEEMTVLYDNRIWEFVPLPEGKIIVGCRKVLTIKVGSDGTIDRVKVRLVAKGYKIYDIDYRDTCLPVAKIAYVRLLISMAAMYHCPLSVGHQKYIPT